MKYVNLTLIATLLLVPAAYADSDRQEIKAAMECFYTWDLYGGAENSSKCIADNVQYHRVNRDGTHSFSTPKLDSPDGKGEGTVTHSLVDIDVYNNMAVVTSLHHYMPRSPKNTYVKNIVLYKLKDGWRVSSVSWGQVTVEL